MKKRVKVSVPGSCGELLQGTINDKNILVGCPIDCHTYATIERNEQVEGIIINEEKPKTLLAICKTLEYFGVKTTGFKVTIQSDLLIEKGMASSTADIVAGIIATMTILDQPINLELVTKIAVAIEPTDPCYYNEIIAFDHIEGEIIERLGPIKNHPIIILDVGGKVNTIGFNLDQQLIQLKRAKEKAIEDGYEKIKSGIATNTLELVGEGIHLSALAHQRILFKPNLETLIDYAKTEDKILGVNIAHSGSLVGVILKSQKDTDVIKKKLRRDFSSFKYLMTTTLYSEGYKILEVI
jgi:L-threonine kinase